VKVASRKPTRRFARARWIGQVIAADADEANRTAAVEFRADIRKLIAVHSYGVV
jgi:hypothetical protein